MCKISYFLSNCTMVVFLSSSIFASLPAFSQSELENTQIIATNEEINNTSESEITQEPNLISIQSIEQIQTENTPEESVNAASENWLQNEKSPTNQSDLGHSEKQDNNPREKQKLNLRIIEQDTRRTFENIRLHETYKYPLNQDVQITFTKFDPNQLNPSFSFDTKEVWVEGQLATGYEIKSNMTNGNFEYTLRLPNPTNSTAAKVKYSEDQGQNFKEIIEKTVGTEFIELKNLDHFTIFVVVPDDIKPHNWTSIGSSTLSGWRMVGLGNASTVLAKVSDYGVSENFGPHSIRTTRIGGSGINRSFLGYYEPSRTLNSIEQIKWNQYTVRGNDSYLNIFLVNPTFTQTATVVYQPPQPVGVWSEKVFDSNTNSNLSIRVGSSSPTNVTYSGLMSNYGNWLIVNHLTNLNFIGGIVLVSGSSSPRTPQEHFFDGVTIKFIGENPLYFDFENRIPPEPVQINFGYNTLHNSSSDPQCGVTASDISVSDIASKQIIKWSKVPGAVRYQIQSYKLDTTTNTWQKYGSPYNPAIVAAGDPNISFNDSSDPIVYSTYVIDEGVYTYLIQAFAADGHLVGQSTYINEITGAAPGSACVFIVDRKAYIYWYKVQKDDIFSAENLLAGNMQPADYPGRLQIFDSSNNLVGTIDNTDPNCDTVQVFNGTSDCHKTNGLAVEPGLYSVREINVPAGYEFSWARCMSDPRNTNGAVAVWGPDAEVVGANSVYTNGSFGQTNFNIQAGQKVHCVIHNKKIQYPSYSERRGTIQITKKDDGNQNLSNWQFQIKRVGGSIESLNVSNRQGSSTPDLPAGNYKITVSGTYNYGPNIVADAGYSLRDNSEFNSPTWWPSYLVVNYGTQKWLNAYNWMIIDHTAHQGLSTTVQPFYDQGIDLSLRINDVCAVPSAPANCTSSNKTSGLIYWGEFNPSHEYTINYQHTGGPITFSIRDNAYSDNSSGNIKITIETINEFEITDTNGIATFTVPVGTYTLSEIMQEGWELSSITGCTQTGEMASCTVTVTEHETTKVTFVNKKQDIGDEGSGDESLGNSSGNDKNNGGSGSSGNQNTGNGSNNTQSLSSGNTVNTNFVLSNTENDYENDDSDSSQASVEVDTKLPLAEIDESILPIVLGKQEVVEDIGRCEENNFPWWLVLLLILSATSSMVYLVMDNKQQLKKRDEQDE